MPTARGGLPLLWGHGRKPITARLYAILSFIPSHVPEAERGGEGAPPAPIEAALPPHAAPPTARLSHRPPPHTQAIEYIGGRRRLGGAGSASTE